MSSYPFILIQNANAIQNEISVHSLEAFCTKYAKRAIILILEKSFRADKKFNTYKH